MQNGHIAISPSTGAAAFLWLTFTHITSGCSPTARGGYAYPTAGGSSLQGEKRGAISPDAAPIGSRPLPPYASILPGGDNKLYFTAYVDSSGQIHLRGEPVTEEEFIQEARKALEASPQVVALLFVESGMMQGVHLSAELSKLGFRNVQAFYPTATNR